MVFFGLGLGSEAILVPMPVFRNKKKLMMIAKFVKVLSTFFQIETCDRSIENFFE